MNSRTAGKGQLDICILEFAHSVRQKLVQLLNGHLQYLLGYQTNSFYANVCYEKPEKFHKYMVI